MRKNMPHNTSPTRLDLLTLGGLEPRIKALEEKSKDKKASWISYLSIGTTVFIGIVAILIPMYYTFNSEMRNKIVNNTLSIKDTRDKLLNTTNESQLNTQRLNKDDNKIKENYTYIHDYKLFKKYINLENSLQNKKTHKK